MDDIEGNIENSLSDLKNFYTTSGNFNASDFWDNFLEINTNDSNNAYGSYLNLSKDLENIIGEKNSKMLDDVNRNGGFMSIQKCVSGDSVTYGESSQQTACNKTYQSCMESSNTSSCESSYKSCLNNATSSEVCKYVTPGSIVANEVSEVIGIERESIQLADEFDELIEALITQLVSKIFDGDSGGLSGISNSDLTSAQTDISEEKYQLLKMYDTRAYELEEKILNSAYRTLLNYQVFSKTLIQSWENKRNLLNTNNGNIYRLSDSEPKYTKLVESTINTNIAALEYKNNQLNDDIKYVKEQIKESEKSLALLESRMTQIENTRDLNQL
ncbi:hypothetical protein LDC_2671 [sediment metagenome]|uniref:Uncharacterized protein n=1 Tax=sediment metagenome TaxID=749907 RepID=D9PM93_9ZZZZ